MTAIECIRQIESNEFYIEKTKKRIEELENYAKNLSSKPFDRERVKTSGDKDRVANLTVRIMDEKEKLIRFVIDNEDLRVYVMNQIDNIDDLTLEKILYYRHFEKKGYPEIADLLDLSPKTVRNQHSKAIKILEKTFIEP